MSMTPITMKFTNYRTRVTSVAARLENTVGQHALFHFARSKSHYLNPTTSPCLHVDGRLRSH